MRGNLRTLLLAYSAGVLSAALVPQPRVWIWWSLAGVIVTVVMCWHTRRCRHPWQQCWSLLLAALVGVSWHLLWSASILTQRLPPDLEGRNMWVTGTVINLPERTPTATQFQFYIEQSDLGFAGRRILLNFYSDVAVQARQRWQLLVRLNRPHGFANPGGFDYEAWLFQQRISAKGYVRENSSNQLLGSRPYSIQVIRSKVQERMTAYADRLPNIGILLALSLGDQSQLPSSDWDLMSASGTNHLFVISGLHIVLIAATAFWLAGCCLRWVPRLSLIYPRQKFGYWCALLAALLYSLLAGFNLPTQRAFIMTALLVAGQLGSRPVPVSVRFLFSLAVVVTLNPLAALSAGFWLSFVAVAALLIFVNSRQDAAAPPRPAYTLVQQWYQPQLVVFLALTPLLILWTQQISLLSPIINMFAIPLVGLIVVPLTLLGAGLLFVFDPLGLLLLIVGDRLLEFLFVVIAWIVARAQWTLLDLHGMSYTQLLCISIAVLLFLLPVRRALRVLVLPLLLPVVFPIRETPVHGQLDVHILDVGQGLSVVLRTANHVLVYDIGAELSPEFNLGTAVVVPVLRELEVSMIDKVVVSHFDNDHAGGLAGLLSQMPVSELLSSEPQRAAAVLAGAKLKSAAIISGACAAGQHWRWDGIDFSILHPQAAGWLESGAMTASENDHSCVLQIRSGELSLLLPGDIEQTAERSLALAQGVKLRSTLLLAPHHGSNTSSTYAFIKQVAPRFVVYTSGYRNSFGHPTARTRLRYADLGSEQYVTHDTGMLSFRLQPGQPLLAPEQFRQTRMRYWH